MNCESFGRSIHAWLAGHLEAEPRAAFERHRDGCEPCRERARRHAEFCCREFVAVLDPYLEGELSHEEREVLEVHLLLCAPCERFADSYRLTIELARRAGEPRPADSDELPPDLVRAILDSLRRE